MKDKKIEKKGLVQGIKGKGEEGQIWWKYYVSYE
jgi:hypothetical protein